MKGFFTVFFAILAAASVIITALWAKSKVDTWESAWRSYEAQISAIVSAEHALNGPADSTTSVSSYEEGMARIDQLIVRLKRIEENTPEIVDLEQRTVAVLEHKPFGLPLTASERKELTAVKEDLQKEIATLKEGVQKHSGK